MEKEGWREQFRVEGIAEEKELKTARSSALTLQKTFAKISSQVLTGIGITNSPEPEELKEIRVRKPEVTPSNGLRCEKPIRRQTPNETFHRYCAELWSIRAKRPSVCPYCKQTVNPGDEITLFEKVGGWSHLYHATDQEATMPETMRL
ncbi:hypothetical protein MUP05_03810 [Candidatus Bathyarchaeota archaeon]|nr:hypothetical protein [Candidatus Bathyarchaeota archaeon]